MQSTRSQYLSLIVGTINTLGLPERREILRLIVADIGISKLTEGLDGCRILINDISDDTISNILDIIAKVGFGLLIWIEVVNLRLNHLISNKYNIQI